MENRSEELKQYLQPGKHIHLVGIGGVSMRPLGLVLQGMGMVVTGSDCQRYSGNHWPPGRKYTGSGLRDPYCRSP